MSTARDAASDRGAAAKEVEESMGRRLSLEARVAKIWGASAGGGMARARADARMAQVRLLGACQAACEGQRGVRLAVVEEEAHRLAVAAGSWPQACSRIVRRAFGGLWRNALLERALRCEHWPRVRRKALVQGLKRLKVHARVRKALRRGQRSGALRGAWAVWAFAATVRR